MVHHPDLSEDTQRLIERLQRLTEEFRRTCAMSRHAIETSAQILQPKPKSAIIGGGLADGNATGRQLT